MLGTNQRCSAVSGGVLVHIGDFQKLIAQKIENLRPKLLDLSRRNPLISSRISGKSSSTVRVVDELPDALFYKLTNQQPMQIVPLPDVNADPKDEDTKEFRDAVTNARLTDEIYLAATEGVNLDAEDYVDQVRRIERELKDRLRDVVGLPPRPKIGDVNLVQHAKNNGITPSYDLPKPDQEHPDGRHTDEKIQTLLLPRDLERRLNAISAKCRTWVQETGINVLQVAFGFLEWSEPGNFEATSFAPLILAPAHLEKEKTRAGFEFWLSATGEGVECNTVLAEKLRLEFGIIMPEFDGASVEAYFSAIQKIVPADMIWKVRRQVAVGVFPSARMAMYFDLQAGDPKIIENAIVQSLLGGSGSVSSAPFADEYLVDEPEIEALVPCTVLDTDSSQFSALVDIAKGKNLAVEGPPGTGKSQTIVNAIAGALADGKKVLFVAEKLAALNEVRARLEAVGLGEYLLPLQAERSSRERVIESMRSRLEMEAPKGIRHYESKISAFRAVRAELANYIGILKRQFRQTGLTVHELLGKCISITPILAKVPLVVQRQCDVHSSLLTGDGLGTLRAVSRRVVQAHKGIVGRSEVWQSTKFEHPDRFATEEACQLAGDAAAAYAGLEKFRVELSNIASSPDAEVEELRLLKDFISRANALRGRLDPSILRALTDYRLSERLQTFSLDCRTCTTMTSELQAILKADVSSSTLSAVTRIGKICEETGVTSLGADELAKTSSDWRAGIDSVDAILAKLLPLARVCPDASNWSVTDLMKARAIVSSAGFEVLTLRSPDLSEARANRQIARLCAEGKALKAGRDELFTRVSLVEDIPTDDLVTCLTTIRRSGLFRIFSRKYRRAKALAKAVTGNRRFKKSEATPLIEELVAFKKRETEFARIAESGRVFGSEFRGLDTDFDAFARLSSFYDAVASEFSSPDKRSIRDFLRNAATEDVVIIPEINGARDDLTLRALCELRENWATRFERIEQGVIELTQLISVFRNPAAIAPASLALIVSRIRDVLESRANLQRNDDIATVLREHFKGWQTNQSLLNEIVDLIETLPRSPRTAEAIVSIAEREDLQRVAQIVENTIQAALGARTALLELCEFAQLDPDSVLTGQTADSISKKLSQASEDTEGLFAYSNYAAALSDFTRAGLSPLLSHCISSQIELAALPEQCEALAVRKLGQMVFQDYGAKLASYTGARLDELRAELANKDREIIELSRQQLRAKLFSTARPPSGNGVGRKSTWSELALLKNEADKKQRFISVRDLSDRAGRAMLELKPCWMMSPLAVAQYVSKEKLQFDLCIIDEASQMPPESAIGALVRSKQAVIVGDTNQLPPTSFFKTMLDDDDSDEDEAVLDESILAMANAAFRPSRRLRWHYRSRHSGLIKFSNRMVYGDDLVVFPSANEQNNRMGVEYRRVDGLYKSGTNPIEARAVVDAIFEFVRTDRDRSLGVVTLNQKQRELIREEFEATLAQDPAASAYLEEWKQNRDGLEEFFISNLENVQGQQRDVIFISTVYGPEASGGRTAQRFGPVNGLAGKRRLNVLFSRAKEKVVTFSSMTSSDIVAEEGGNPGAFMLKRWLEYVATGSMDGGQETKRDADSEFEIFVAQQIQAMGFEPVHQVGAAGYFIDIGVRHPQWPHGYVLGVECDGAAYHSAKSARDRDRLRQQFLEDLGWKLHRIWSTDWFNNPSKEGDRLRSVLVARLADLKKKESEFLRSPSVAEAQNSDGGTEKAGAQIAAVATQANRQPAQQNLFDRRQAEGVAVGDTVRVRYIDGDRKTIQVTISQSLNAPDNGIIHHKSPIGNALLGAEQGDEVEILVGSYIRRAIVESVTRAQ